jgi:hypothetical protein
MTNLIQSLTPHDLGHLRIAADLWGFELACLDVQSARGELAASMLGDEKLADLVETLPDESRLALATLATGKGRIPWAEFTRRFGELRDVGAGRRDREQVFLQPVSSTEILFYRALIGRAFFDTPSGPQEFAYIPDDLLALLPRVNPQSSPIPGRLASPVERRHPILANDHILDDACTLLSALRMGRNGAQGSVSTSIPEGVLLEFLVAAGLVKIPEDPGRGWVPQPETIKDFLEESRSESLARLVKAWLGSASFNELRQVPGLVCEGTWSNDAVATRHFILGLLGRISAGKWWSLPAFVHMVHEMHPDFERPSGDFDSWLIRRAADDAFMHGFDHWDDVDGALLRYILTGPMYWLGLLDLASAQEGGDPSAFRLTGWSKDLLQGHPPKGLPHEDGRLHASANGSITISMLLPRSVRYQLARFSEWQGDRKDETIYRLTPASLKNAMQQGLRISHLLTLLNKYAAAPLPPPFVRALTRWELNGTEARLEQPVILHLSSPEVMEELRHSRAGRFLGEILGPTTVVVKPGAKSKILAAMNELGLLTDEAIKADIIPHGENNHE